MNARQYDPLTYRHPRTLGEAFLCDAKEAVAIFASKKSVAARVYDAWCVLCVCAGGAGLVAAALDYFDVLVP